MKLRHHRKRRNALVRIHAFCARVDRLERWSQLVCSARQCGKTWAAERLGGLDSLTDGFTNDLIDALKYGFSWSRQTYQQEFIQSLELPPIEQAARQIVQDAEMFDRTLEHYFRAGEMEAVPIGCDLGVSNRHYQQLLRQAGDRLGLRTMGEREELCRAARRYSQSREYMQWLRENPPEARHETP